jgi:ParB/RepB/Spo0J family partition protein
MNRSLDSLRPHPRNEEIYGGLEDAELTESIRAKGILTPLLITPDGRIVGGHRRWTAARAAGLIEVPVVLFESEDELEILEAVLENNRQRVKSAEVMANEGAVLAEIEGLRAKQRQREAAETTNAKRNGTHTQLVAYASAPGETRKKVAERLGVSHQTAQKAIQVGQALATLKESESQEDQEKRRSLQKVLKERGIIPAAALLGSVRQPRDPNAAPKSQSRFTETNDKVSWARWTWNPVTGCLHDCPYCYARDIANRRYPEKFAPTFRPERLPAARNTPLPEAGDPESRRVFVCSMADLFGKWVPQEWIDAVFAEVRDNPQWEFLFLTKFPQRLAEIEWPENAWVGTTVDRQYRVDIAEKAFRGVKAGVKWLSCEPLLEPLKFSSLEMFDWVVIGGASRSTQTPEFWPPFEWMVDLYQQAREAGCKVWFKPNALSELTQCPQEIPR